MNLRILKKLSKRAAPMLRAVGDCREQFAAKKGANFQNLTGHERKHWHRMRGRTSIRLYEPFHPLKGTAMAGCTSGYDTSEWEEESTWEALRNAVTYCSGQWGEDGQFRVLRKLRTPTHILRAATELAHQENASVFAKTPHQRRF